MGYSKGRERFHNINDATRKGKHYRKYIIDATKIWDIVKGGKDFIT